MEAERCRRSLLVGIDGVVEIGNDPGRMAAWDRIDLHVMESLLLDEGRASPRTTLVPSLAT